MALVSWDSSLSVNVEEIDGQHQKLVGMLNDLHVAMLAGEGGEVLSKILEGLLDYTVYHFGTEEKYFDLYGYPETPLHKQQHREFVEKVIDFKQRYDEGEAALSVEVLDFLAGWVKQHIKGSDKKYGPFFNEKGLK